MIKLEVTGDSFAEILQQLGGIGGQIGKNTTPALAASKNDKSKTSTDDEEGDATAEMIRAASAEKASGGKGAEVKKLLKTFKIEKISDIADGDNQEQKNKFLKALKAL